MTFNFHDAEEIFKALENCSISNLDNENYMEMAIAI